MSLNANHTFEELDGVKCAIVEKNVTPKRVEFLRWLLEGNGYKVVVVNSPPPKGAKPPVEGETVTLPETFTVGVTDVTFSTMNAVFNRELRIEDGTIVTAAYWRQEEEHPQKDEWYWK